MLLLRRILVVCFLFFSSASGGLFEKSWQKPNTQSKGASGTWGIPDLGKWIPDMPIPSLKLPFPFLAQNVKAPPATTMQNPTTESPPKSSEIITTRDDTVSVEAQVATTIQNPATESSDIITTQDHTLSVEAQAATTIQNPVNESSNIITKQDYTVSVETHVTTTLQSPTSERPTTSSNIISQGYAVLVEAPTSPTYQIITLHPEETPTSPAQIGTLLPHRGTKPPKNNLLRGSQQTDKPKPLSEPDPNFDLEFWPPNRGRYSEKTPQTAPPPVSTRETNGYVTGTWQEPSTSSTQETSTSSAQVIQRTKQTTKSAEFQNAKTKSPENDQITNTDFQSFTTLEPWLMTSLTKVIKSTTAQQQPAVSTSLPTEPTTKLQLSLTTALDRTQIVEETPVAHQTPEVEATNEHPDRRPWLVLSTSVPQEGHLGSIPNFTHTALTTASSAGEMPTTVSDDWLPDMIQESALPDCNAEHSGLCNYSIPWAPTYPSDNSNNDSIPTSSSNQSQSPMLFPSLPMFVPLYSDWNSAMASWGLAWEAHIYGMGTAFCLISLASALNLLCLPLCCPSGCGYFALVSLFLLAAGCTRAFTLLYDAYGHQDRMTSIEASLLLYEAPFPCITAAFGLVFLLLSMRSRMQLSYSTFQRPCFLACLVLLHFAAAFGPVTLLQVDQQGAPLCLFLSLISRGAFVALATFLSVAYFVFYCYVRADSKHIYHLNNTSPTPAERYNRCPFAESQDWDRAAVAMFLSAIFSLACAGLQLYAMLHALGVAGGAEVFRPWPWWAFQLSCRVCEAVVCLTLALVVSQPVYCSEHIPQPGSCWMELLAAKSPIIPGSYQWTLTQQEKLAICDPIGHGETECLPLYTLVDDRMGSLNGLDLLYHSNRALAYRDLDLDLPETVPNTGAPSVGSSYTSDSTADLRPPSPINLRRSIDEALFSEALFPMSLFSPMRPFTSSDHSLEGRDTGSTSGPTFRETHPSDPGLYRTSSCMEMQAKPPLPVQAQQDAPSLAFPPSPSPSLTSSCCSSAEHWRGSSCSCSLYRPSLAGSSLVLCSSPEGQNPAVSTTSGGSGCTATAGQQRHYRTQNSQEYLEQRPELDQSVQEEFISVCRQIDALSVCSETIDL
uniref:Proline-rich transmembrane protein 3/4 domain-containing protein n=1 Tax=Pygocentrus nattereri TaxID=42514 RepID=A0A3B4DL97_PYGNA